MCLHHCALPSSAKCVVHCLNFGREDSTENEVDGGRNWHLLKGHLKADGGKKRQTQIRTSVASISVCRPLWPPLFLVGGPVAHFQDVLASIMMMTALYFVPQKGEDASCKVGGWKHLWNIHQVGSVSLGLLIIISWPSSVV
jgi:hypothetical protein